MHFSLLFFISDGVELISLIVTVLSLLFFSISKKVIFILAGSLCISCCFNLPNILDKGHWQGGSEDLIILIGTE